MSVEELLRTHEYNRNNGLSLNIDCGFLRRIGKTECLRYLIRNKPVSTRGILLLPNSYVRNWSEELRNYNLVCLTRQNFSNTPPFLTSEQNFIYADEIPEAESVVRNWGRRNNIFIAGFYSITLSRSEYSGFSGYSGVSGYSGFSRYVGIGTTEPEFRSRTTEQELESEFSTVGIGTTVFEEPKDPQNKMKFIIKDKIIEQGKITSKNNNMQNKMKFIENHKQNDALTKKFLDYFKKKSILI